MKGGELIREARRRAGLSQGELAARLETRQPVIARWESGDRSPSFESVVRAVRECGLDIHPQLANRDATVDAVISRWRRLTPAQRLRQNEAMLLTEERVQGAGRETGTRTRAKSGGC
jgi:transcriptional regulator with XRE-family HTH domain